MKSYKIIYIALIIFFLIYTFFYFLESFKTENKIFFVEKYPNVKLSDLISIDEKKVSYLEVTKFKEKEVAYSCIYRDEFKICVVDLGIIEKWNIVVSKKNNYNTETAITFINSSFSESNNFNTWPIQSVDLDNYIENKIRKVSLVGKEIQISSMQEENIFEFKTYGTYYIVINDSKKVYLKNVNPFEDNFENKKYKLGAQIPTKLTNFKFVKKSNHLYLLSLVNEDWEDL